MGCVGQCLRLYPEVPVLRMVRCEASDGQTPGPDAGDRGAGGGGHWLCAYQRLVVPCVRDAAASREACFRMVRMTTPSPSAFDPRAFEGTAGYYAAGRPPYSAQLADTMARELSLDGTGQLLDVGCGPGVLVLPLARLFGQVTALDPEPGMLQAGRRRCQQAGVANVRWVQGVAEDIAALDLGSWRAVTFGQSFHRVRRLEVAEAVYDLLVPGGSLVLISHHVDGRPRPADPGYPEVPPTPRCGRSSSTTSATARAVTWQPGTRASRHALRTPWRRPGSAARGPSTRLGAPT